MEQLSVPTNLFGCRTYAILLAIQFAVVPGKIIDLILRAASRS
jgi:hypothetical protein